MDSQKSKLMKMYKKQKSNRSNKSCKSMIKCIKSGKKRSKHDKLDKYLSIAIQRNSSFHLLPIVILEKIFYDYFFPFQKYRFVGVCKLFRYIIDDSIQNELNDGINDDRIHNFRLNAFYFYNNLSIFVVSSIILDLSDERLRQFNKEQIKFISYIFMYQSKLSILYKKQISSSKFKRFKKKEIQQIKKKRLEMKEYETKIQEIYKYT